MPAPNPLSARKSTKTSSRFIRGTAVTSAAIRSELEHITQRSALSTRASLLAAACANTSCTCHRKQKQPGKEAKTCHWYSRCTAPTCLCILCSISRAGGTPPTSEDLSHYSRRDSSRTTGRDGTLHALV